MLWILQESINNTYVSRTVNNIKTLISNSDICKKDTLQNVYTVITVQRSTNTSRIKRVPFMKFTTQMLVYSFLFANLEIPNQTTPAQKPPAYVKASACFGSFFSFCLETAVYLSILWALSRYHWGYLIVPWALNFEAMDTFSDAFTSRPSTSNSEPVNAWSVP